MENRVHEQGRTDIMVGLVDGRRWWDSWSGLMVRWRMVWPFFPVPTIPCAPTLDLRAKQDRRSHLRIRPGEECSWDSWHDEIEDRPGEGTCEWTPAPKHARNYYVLGGVMWGKWKSLNISPTVPQWIY